MNAQSIQQERSQPIETNKQELREEFKSQREDVHNKYKERIKPLKIERDNNARGRIVSQQCTVE